MLNINNLSALFLSILILCFASNSKGQIVVDAGNDTTFCGSGSVTLGGNPTMTGGTAPISYSWSPTTGLSNPTDPNPIATVSTTTTYIVTTTDFNGRGGMDTVTITIINASNVVLDPFPPMCEHDSIQVLNQGHPAGGTYSGPGIVVSPNFNPTLAGAGLHTISYSYTNPNCSTTFTAQRTIFINASPSFTISVVPDSICVGDTAKLIASDPNNTYSWAPATSLSLSSGDSVYAFPTSTQLYYVTGTSDTTGCRRMDSVEVKVTPCIPDGVAENDENITVRIHPNPTNGFLILNDHSKLKTKLRIMDMNGRIVLELSLSPGENKVDMNGLKEGIYLFQTTNALGTAMNKVVLAK